MIPDQSRPTTFSQVALRQCGRSWWTRDWYHVLVS